MSKNSGKPAEGAAGATPGQQQQEVGARSAYSFDSTALERAAQAAKTLEKSTNAKQALELSRLQEISKHKEYELQQKVIIYHLKLH